MYRRRACMDRHHTNHARTSTPARRHTRSQVDRQTTPPVSPHTRAARALRLCRTHQVAPRGITKPENMTPSIDPLLVLASRHVRWWHGMCHMLVNNTGHCQDTTSYSAVYALTVAILAQGTHWAIAAMQAFFPSILMHTHALNGFVVYCMLSWVWLCAGARRCLCAPVCAHRNCWPDKHSFTTRQALLPSEKCIPWLHAFYAAAPWRSLLQACLFLVGAMLLNSLLELTGPTGNAESNRTC